jgi:hypothetical protein
MTVVPCGLAIGCLALALNTHAGAQTRSTAPKLPSEATIENWLLSDDSRLVAWGAHDVLVSRNEALTGDLLNLATEWRPLIPASATDGSAQLSQEQLNKRDAMAAVLDALIQMNVPVPGDTLRTLAPDFPVAVAILLSRMSPEDSEPLALDFYHSPPKLGYGLQYASAAMLAHNPPSGFPPDLMAGITVRADVFVILPDAPGFGFGGGSCGACFMQPNLQRSNWPPIGQYSLSKEKADRSVLLVSGIDAIYVKRYESESYVNPCGGPSLGPYERQRLIAEILGVSPDAISWNIHLTTTIPFYSDEQFGRDLLQFVDNEEQKYRQTAIALVDRGLMTSAEVEQSAPKLEIHTIDMRGENANPMPTIVPFPGKVEWLNEPAWK